MDYDCYLDGLLLLADGNYNNYFYTTQLVSPKLLIQWIYGPHKFAIVVVFLLNLLPVHVMPCLFDFEPMADLHTKLSEFDSGMHVFLPLLV